MCGLFWGAHKFLAPRARTLLGGLRQATLSFFAVATLLFVFLVSVLNFVTSPNSGVKLLGGFLRSEKTIFRFVSSGGASSSCYFLFPLLPSRDDEGPHTPAFLHGAVFCGVSLALCALCCVYFVVARWCLLLFATVLCAVCVLGCVLCFPCSPRSVQCWASLCWCACVVLFLW